MPEAATIRGTRSRRPTPEEAEASYRNNEPWPRADQAMELEDGTIAVEGDDGRWCLEGPGGFPDLNRPAPV